MIYFFQSQDFVKIGWTTDPPTRLRGMQVANPHPVEQVGLIFGGEREEQLLHRAFRSSHHRAEWFRLDGRLPAFVEMIKDLPPFEGRFVVGEWFLSEFGKLEMLLPAKLDSRRER